MNLLGAAKTVLKQVPDLIWPPCCALSDLPVRHHGELHASAWHKLDFICDPQCEICGLPFDFPAAGSDATGTLCASCIAAPPRYDRARSALVYDENSRELILPLKHADRRDSVQRFARWMGLALGAEYPEYSRILPVPLHWRRLLKRRYNQAGLLAAGLGRQLDVPFAPDILRRPRATPSQAGQGTRSRKRNMAGAFAVAGSLEGEPVLLVDDVLTTGATVNACALALKRAGAARVDVVTLCRVVRERDLTI